MPAPQASMMQQLAKLKFTSNAIKTPTDWSQPQGDPAGKHYNDAFKPAEKSAVPPVGALFVSQSTNKYHCDTTKKLHDDFSAFIDGICSAICSGWSQWQMAAALTGGIVNGPTVSGGTLSGPPMMPLIMASAPKDTPQKLKYSKAIAQSISDGWDKFTSTVKIPGLPLFPMFAAFPGPTAPPIPNPVPLMFIMLTQVNASIMPSALKSEMANNLGDSKAPFHAELFGAIADAFDKAYTMWKATTTVVLMGKGPIPTFAPPFVPVGPVLGGTADGIPGSCLV